ncbi:hypothetical protein NKJ84_28330 [Mesorhizobium sp. M0048]|uniref:hypothetical protein n=1 Tax=Mesorhizobium sp. M0048 TaxID=2956860 RepID=UPI003335D8D0
MMQPLVVVISKTLPPGMAEPNSCKIIGYASTFLALSANPELSDSKLDYLSDGTLFRLLVISNYFS